MNSRDLEAMGPVALEEDEDLLRAKINAETAQIAWTGVQRFFAQGRTVHVRPGTDLVEVAVIIGRNDVGRLERLIDNGEVMPVSDAQALEWYDADALVWSVVVKPWVLVQPVMAKQS